MGINLKTSKNPIQSDKLNNLYKGVKQTGLLYIHVFSIMNELALRIKKYVIDHFSWRERNNSLKVPCAFMQFGHSCFAGSHSPNTHIISMLTINLMQVNAPKKLIFT